MTMTKTIKRALTMCNYGPHQRDENLQRRRELTNNDIPTAIYCELSAPTSNVRNGTTVGSLTRCRHPPSARFCPLLPGKPANRSIWNSRVDDDYDASAIGCLGWVFTRNALSATASELILSIARSSSLGTSGLVITSSTLPLKFSASSGHTSAMMRCLPMVVSQLSTNHAEAPRENSETSSTINCCNGSRRMPTVGATWLRSPITLHVEQNGRDSRISLSRPMITMGPTMGGGFGIAWAPAKRNCH